MIVAGRTTVSIYFGVNKIKEIRCNEIETMDVVYCKERKMPFIIVSSKVQMTLS
jgi:hypothetical protein